MKKLSAYLFLILFSFSATSFSDDIRDFQIEGISVGDSLLNFFNKNQIDSIPGTYYPNSKKFKMINLSSEFSLQTYDDFYVSLNEEKNDYIIHEMKGTIDFENKKDCLIEKKKIANFLRELDKGNSKEQSYSQNAAQDKSGESKFYSTDFISEDGTARTYCLIWSEKFKNEKGWKNHIQVVVYDKEFKNFLMNEAWGN